MTVSWHSSSVYPWASFCSLVKYANVDFLVLIIYCSYVRGYLRGYWRLGICDHSVLFFFLQFLWGLWLFQNKEFKPPPPKKIQSVCSKGTVTYNSSLHVNTDISALSVWMWSCNSQCILGRMSLSFLLQNSSVTSPDFHALPFHNHTSLHPYL